MILTVIVMGRALWVQRENMVNRQPEAQNLLVQFGEMPEAPDYPDIGISVRVWPAQVGPGEPVFLAGAYSADGALLTACRQNPAACVVLTLTLLVDPPVKTSLALITPTVQASAPPPGEYGPDYREGAQFQLNLMDFFNLPGTPAEYIVAASIGEYSSGPHSFSVKKP